jgi:type I restriction enzyme S subunit
MKRQAANAPKSLGSRPEPAGWQWLKIGDLAETCSGTTPSRGRSDYYGGKIPWVKTGELVDAEIYDTEEHVTEQAVRETSLRLLPKETLLVAMYGQGQTRGRTGLLKTEATTNQACFAILPSDRFEPAFLQLWFCHSYQRLRDQTEGRGGNQPNLNGNVLRQETVPLPPLVEQRRIVVKLREQMAEVERVRAAVEAQLDAAQTLPAALLRAIFTSPAAQRWPIASLGDVAQVVGGMQKTPDRAPREFHKQFLTVRNVQRGYLDLSNVERFEVTPAEFERLRLQRGDLLIVEGNGSVDHIGRNALFNEEGEWIHQNHIIRVRLSREQFMPEFVSEYLNSEAGCAQMLEKAKSTTGLYTLSTKKIASLAVPMPPLAEQRKVATRLDAELTAARALRESLETRLAEIDLLPATLLRAAFSQAS